jgi:hypothetical protein
VRCAVGDFHVGAGSRITAARPVEHGPVTAAGGLSGPRRARRSPAASASVPSRSRPTVASGGACSAVASSAGGLQTDRKRTADKAGIREDTRTAVRRAFPLLRLRIRTQAVTAGNGASRILSPKTRVRIPVAVPKVPANWGLCDQVGNLGRRTRSPTSLSPRPTTMSLSRGKRSARRALSLLLFGRRKSPRS